MSKNKELQFQRKYDCATCSIECRGAWPPGASTKYKELFCIIKSEDEFNSSREESPRGQSKYRCATTGEQWNIPKWVDA
jgi:hypothetical protein